MIESIPNYETELHVHAHRHWVLKRLLEEWAHLRTGPDNDCYDCLTVDRHFHRHGDADRHDHSGVCYPTHDGTIRSTVGSPDYGGCPCYDGFLYSHLNGSTCDFHDFSKIDEIGSCASSRDFLPTHQSHHCPGIDCCVSNGCYGVSPP
mmetsp:Transcript_34231/g.74106  ORF Transcript_34231/g.74106 Transcript_34231/m.74106 type:complete len:148 (+) Transcript_34231:3184-3627(+)